MDAPHQDDNTRRRMPDTGLPRRRERLGEAQTTRRMLDAARRQIERSGLTVSLEHLSFEEIIQDAGVSRSTAYRRWPYKDLFFSELLVDLAGGAAPTAVSDAGAATFVTELVRAHAPRVHTAAGRHDLAVEIFRLGSTRDFEIMLGALEWRTYLALHATFQGLGDGELRARVAEALDRSERAFVERLATAYAGFADLLGYRLRPETGTTFVMLATLASATVRGLVLMALASPTLVATTTTAKPFGARRVDEWSMPALALAALATACLEPDPEVRWTRTRVAHLRAALAADDLVTPHTIDHARSDR
jgi:AcrR family transcriptional regulator